MPLGPRDLLAVHARAFNAQDLETLVGQYTAAARFIRDGKWVGEGHAAVRKGLEEEMSGAVHGRLLDIDGEPVLVEYTGEEGRDEPRGVIRFEVVGSQVAECRVDHGAAAVARLRSLNGDG